VEFINVPEIKTTLILSLDVTRETKLCEESKENIISVVTHFTIIINLIKCGIEWEEPNDKREGN
jgi:hypothetical protein